MAESSVADQPHVLAVTSEPTISEELSKQLDSLFRVTVVGTADAALATLDRNNDIQCVVCDQDLPAVDGIALLESVRVQQPYLPFIIVTREGTETIASRAIHARVTDYFIADQFDDQWDRLGDLITQAIEYQEVQSRLTDAETRAKDILEALPDAGLIIQDDTVAYANQRAREMFSSASTPDLIGRTIDDVPPILKTLFEDRVSIEASEGSYIEQFELGADETGVLTHIDVIAAQVTWRASQAVLLIARDITARKMDEQASRRSQQELEQILDSLPESVFLHRANGEMLFVNQRACLRTGYSMETLLDMSAPELLPADAPISYDELRETVTETSSPVQFQTTFETPTGEQLHIEINSTAISYQGEQAILSVARDIGQRVEAEYNLVRMQRAIEATGHAVYITDADGTIKYVNPAFEAITGYSAAEAIGENPRILKSGEMPAEYYEDLWGTLLAGEIWREELVNQRKDGEHYYAHQTIAPVTDDDGEIEAFVAIQTDITEKVEQEHELERQLDLFEQAQSMAQIGAWEYNMQAGEGWWTDEVARIHGLPTDVTPTPELSLEQYHPEDRSVIETAFDRAIEHGESYDLELRFIDAADEEKWVRTRGEPQSEDGEIVRIRGTIQDITDRKRLENDLKSSKERYEALFNSIRDAILVADTDRRITNCNPAFNELFGYELSEIEGKPTRILYEIDAEFESMGEAIQDHIGDPRFTHTVRCETKGGRVFPGETSVFALRDREGDIIGTIGLIRDVSDREDRIQQLQVMDRILRHNLHNDMNIIRGYAETIRDATIGPTADNAETIITESDRLLTTVDKEREITKLLSAERLTRSIDLGTIIDASVAAAREHSPQAAITVDRPDEVWALAIPELPQAIDELLMNALYHSDRDEPTVHIEINKIEDRVEIRVTDDGPGIPEMEQNVLTGAADIEPLYHGSGLGLWLVQLIVKESDGSLSFADNEPRGSVVIIRLRRETTEMTRE